MRPLFLTLFVCSLRLCSADADDLRLSPEDRRAEVEWLERLGLKVPEGGPLLEAPFSEPLSRRSFLVPTSWWRQPGPRDVSASAMRQDVAVLHTIMKKAYGGWDSAIKLGWDWDAWFREWDRDLAAKGDARLGLAEALAPFERLERVQLDNHSGPLDRSVSYESGSRTAVLASAPKDTCTQMKTNTGEVLPLQPQDPAQAPKRAQILAGPESAGVEGFYLSYPSRRGEATAVQCGGDWIPLRMWGSTSRQAAISELAGRDGGVPSYRTLAEKIGYLRLPTFSKQTGELVRKLVAALPPGAGKEKLLVVDLRRNGGGDNVMAQMRQWVDVAALRQAMRGNRRMPQSCVYDALRWGYTQITSQALTPALSTGLRNNLQGQLNGLFQPGPVGCPRTVSEVGSDWNYRRHDATARPPAGHPRLMLLTDRGCGSDCEYMVYVLAAVPGSVVVGESTFGVGQFVQPGYFILPHTLLKFRIALGMSDNYGDGRSFDGYGLGPDILLASEEANRPETILKLAQRLAEF